MFEFHQSESSPDTRVLSIADRRELLSEERIDLSVDGNQLTQSLGGSQPHRTTGVLQGLQEGSLKLREEGLQGNAHLKTQHDPQVRRLTQFDHLVGF